MATLSTSILPLRCSKAENSSNDKRSNGQNIVQLLIQYVAANPSRCGDISSPDCEMDFQRMQVLRDRICNTPQTSTDNRTELLEDMHEYYNCLLECEAKGISGFEEEEGEAYGRSVMMEWKSALSGEQQMYATLEWERANIIWNIVVLETCLACKQTVDCKIGWGAAAKHFQSAASWIHHISPAVAHIAMDFSDTFLEFWQVMLMAQSQRCLYESSACAARPRHLVLSKLAAAAVPLFNEMEAVVRHDENSPSPILIQIPALTNEWADYCRAWGMHMSSRAEYHQALVHKSKKQFGLELARLDLASQFATLCSQYCQRAPINSLQYLRERVDADLSIMDQEIQISRHDNETIYRQAIPDPQDLPDIRGEKLVNIDQPLTSLLLPMKGEPLFQGATNKSYLRDYIDLFYSEMSAIYEELVTIADERTESAKQTLATINLPHSLTCYEQEQRGGGIPLPLWDRVAALQKENRITQLQQDLWDLRDSADIARTTYNAIDSQLKFDLESDQLYRQENSGFAGHDVGRVQKPFRHELEKYNQLLATAQEGDALLLERLEQLDTNPKYKLLQFRKEQLDRLLPDTRNQSNPEQSFDTSQLRRLLTDLSTLLKDRDDLIATLQEGIKKYDIQDVLERMCGSGNPQECQDAVQLARSNFDNLIYDIQSNFKYQLQLLDAVLVENEQFLIVRDRRSHSSQSGDSCIGMIEDALIKIEELSTHLMEGKSFYDVLIPKLDILKEQSDDLSARLTAERLDYDDRANRSRQEEQDAEMAKRMDALAAEPTPPPKPTIPQELLDPRNSGSVSSDGMTSDRDSTIFRIDEEKASTLLGMGFSAERVVEALRANENDVDQALNELLVDQA